MIFQSRESKTKGVVKLRNKAVLSSTNCSDLICLERPFKCMSKRKIGRPRSVASARFSRTMTLNIPLFTIPDALEDLSFEDGENYVLCIVVPHDHIEIQAMTTSNGKPLITEQAYPRA